MSDLLQFGTHPDADQLNAFMEHALPEHQRQITLAHLAVCPDCRAAVALSVRATEVGEEREPGRRRWFSGWNLAWAAVPAFAALAIFVVRVHHGDTPIQVAESRPPARPAPLADRVAPPAASVAPPARLSARPLAPRKKAASAIGPDSAAARSGAVELPSGLPVLSMVSNDHRRLAIDTQHALFSSNDDGQHWRAVAPQWQGRVVRIALQAASPPMELGRNAIVITGSLPEAAKFRALAAESSRKQLDGSTLDGVVTDPSGAVIPGVKVTATDARIPLVRSAETDHEGHYRLDNLAPGSYQVEAQAPGFTKGATSVDLASSRQSTADFKLSVGAATSSVEVTAEAVSIPVDAVNALPVFEITTDTGAHWISADGQTWKHK